MNIFRRIAVWMTGVTLTFLFSPLSTVWATPVEVLLFPEFAQVTEVSRPMVHSEGKGQGTVHLTLPGGVHTESLRFFLEEDPEVRIDDISWRILGSRRQGQKEAQQKQLRILTDERKRLSAVIKGLETEIAFWQSQTKAKTKTLKDATNLSAAISRNTKKAWQEKMTLEGECEKLDLRIAGLAEEMKKSAVADDGDREATLSLTGLKPEKRNLSLKYTYILSNCGWTPLYRLEGRTREAQVQFSWEAEVWQNSPQDWNSIQLSLANQPPPAAIVPEKSPEWKIDASRTGKRKGSGKEEIAVAAAAPLRNPVAPFRRSLGKRSVATGRNQILAVENAYWPATFIRVLRPFSSHVSDIRAVVTSASPIQIPEYPALFLLDGVLVGRQVFSFNGQEKVLSFGSDPSVSVEVRMGAEPGKAPDISGDKQVWNWQWQTVLKNGGAQEVKVRVEEPLPQIRDRRIKSDLRGEPAFTEEQAAMGIRDLELSPGGSRTLNTSIHIEAPRDLQVEMTWSP